jgi:oligopeptide/dipeptide ABC transporter ATP-binding protein
MSKPLLEVRDLTVDLMVRRTRRRVVRGVSIAVERGQIHALVGESGAGKTVTGRAIARLLPQTAVVTGSIEIDEASVMALRGAQLRAFRAGHVATIFQDPLAHMNPVRRVGDFLTEAMRIVSGMSAAAARERGLGLLEEVGVSSGERVMRQYPFQLSGGLLQRVMIAAALSTEPKLLIADEPTTALDVTTQKEVVCLLQRLCRDHGLAVLLVTHDLHLAAGVCDRVSVLYAGQVVESGPVNAVYERPRHPYTAGLLAARPRVDKVMPRLAVIPGSPPGADYAPEHGCSFATRCAHASSACRAGAVDLLIDDGVQARCLKPGITTEIAVGDADDGAAFRGAAAPAHAAAPAQEDAR